MIVYVGEPAAQMCGDGVPNAVRAFRKSHHRFKSNPRRWRCATKKERRFPAALKVIQGDATMTSKLWWCF